MNFVVLFDNGEHRNILLPSHNTSKYAVDSNQHLIIHKSSAMLLDPGGHKVYNKVLGDTFALLGGKAKLTHLFFSHQDPDIVAAINGWLLSTGARGYISDVWMPFISHFGLSPQLEGQLSPLDYRGETIDLEGCHLKAIPAHFLHSSGNFQLYDPISKILYTGDLGASVGEPYREVADFEEHLQYMEPFHRRYMTSHRALRLWLREVRNLDIEIIAPQHGAYFKGKELVEKFFSWCENLKCGLDLIDSYQLPSKYL